MSRWRRAFDRIGGPDAVTWPAFWITYAAAILGHLTTGGEIDASTGMRILLVTVSQIAMFAPLVLLRLTLLRDPPRPRPWVAVGGFIIAAIIRGVTITSLLIAIGAVQQPLWAYRIAAALQTQAVILLIVAVVVSTLRAHTRSLESLDSLQSSLAMTQERIIAEVTDRNEDVLLQVQDRLRRELTALESAQGADSVTELQRLASDVVRPMSHELARSLPATQVPGAGDGDAHVSWQQAVTQMVDRAPFRPVLAAGLMGFLMITATLGVFGRQGVALTLAAFVSVLALSLLANAVLSRILPRRTSRASLVIIIIAALAVGYPSAGMSAWALGYPDLVAVFLLGGGAFITGVVLMLALVSAVLRSQQVSEQSLIAHTELLRREVVRLRQAQWLQQQRISRALHGPVQSAITSAALRVDVAVQSGQPTHSLVSEIREELRSVVDVLSAAEAEVPSLDLACARISGTWEGLCEVTSAWTAQARRLFDDDPVAAAIVVDILTEAVSNAVRHGGATQATISLSSPQEGVIDLQVTDNGHSDDAASTSGGLGTSLLTECTLAWARQLSDEGHVLTASLPAGPTAA